MALQDKISTNLPLVLTSKWVTFPAWLPSSRPGPEAVTFPGSAAGSTFT